MTTIGELARRVDPDAPWHLLDGSVMVPRRATLRGFDGLRFLRAIDTTRRACIQFGLQLGPPTLPDYFPPRRRSR